jgi:competence protein ComEC
VRKEPLLLPCAALASGILSGHFFYFRLPDLYVALALACVALILILVRREKRTISLLVSCVCFWLCGLVTETVHRQGAAPKLDAEDGDVVLLDGCVSNPPVFSPNREQFTLNLSRQAAVRLTVNLKNSDGVALDYGRRVEVTAKVRKPRNFQNPAAFDYQGYLAAQHIYWNGSIADPRDIRTLNGRCGSRAVGWLFQIRTWALDRIRQLYPDDQHTIALLQATLLGETSGVDKRWTSDFRVTGTYHALVISGQHVSVLAFSLLLFLRLLRFRRVPALGVATIASWLYAFISGFSSPVVRAAGGFTLFLIASFCFRKTRILNILAAVGIVYLIFAPDELFDPSFQLSFLSAAAIAAFAIPLMECVTDPMRTAVKRFDQIRYDPQMPPSAGQWRVELRLLARTIQLLTRIPAGTSLFLVQYGTLLSAFIVDAIIVSACVQFGLALPMISYFHCLSITGLSANIVIIPLLSLVVPVGFACILTGWHTLAAGNKMLLVTAERVAAWHASFEPAWRMASVPLWLCISFAASLVLLAYVVRKQCALVLITLTASLVLFCAICFQPWKAEVRRGWMELSAIDVGQGDSLLLVFPDGETMLVDAGGFPGAERMSRKPQLDFGEDVVAPYLWNRRIRHLDYAVLTHGHSDHMGGLPAILDDFRPKQLWIGAEPESAEWKNVEQHAKDDGVAVRHLTRVDKAIELGGARIRVLAPAPDYVPGEHAGNNDSLVLEVTFGKRSILLTGDAERASEQEMLDSGMLHPVTLLKVGHHGSKTSSSQDFLDSLNPRFALISDGYKNQFHHPNADVLARLMGHHAAIFRTDEHGLITFRTNGDQVELTSFR